MSDETATPLVTRSLNDKPLLPCPFCGSSARVLGGGCSQDYEEVWCQNNLCLAHASPKVWNKRMSEQVSGNPPVLTAAMKHNIADSIVLESRSKSDVVQDVWDEIMERLYAK